MSFHFTFDLYLSDEIVVPIAASGNPGRGASPCSNHDSPDFSDPGHGAEVDNIQIDMLSDMGRKFTLAGLTREHVEKVLDIIYSVWRFQAHECALDNISDASADAAEAARDNEAD